MIKILTIIGLAIALAFCAVFIWQLWSIISVNKLFENSDLEPNDDQDPNAEAFPVYLMLEDSYLNSSLSGVTFTSEPEVFHIKPNYVGSKYVRIYDSDNNYVCANDTVYFVCDEEESIWQFVGDFIASGSKLLKIVPVQED